MEARELVFLILPFVVAVALGIGFLLVFQQRAAIDDATRRRAQLAEPDLATPLRDPPPPRRPWWGNPWVWLAVSVAFVLMGIFVWPGLFGGTFFFLPLIWIWRPRQRPVDPRTNGHGSGADPGSLGG